MKVDKTSRERSGGLNWPIRGEERHGPLSLKTESFDKTVYIVEVESLLNELDEVGNRLSRVPSLVVLGQYRELIRQLLDRALKGVRLKKDLRWRRTERKAFVVVEQTEAWLKELEDVLFRENQRTRALKLMEDIKGCLISLLF